MEEFYWNDGDISKFEFTLNPDTSGKVIEDILDEAYRLEARYAKRPKYLILGVAEQMLIRACHMMQDKYDSGGLVNLYGMIIVPVPLESFCQLAFEDAALTRTRYFYEKDKIDR